MAETQVCSQGCRVLNYEIWLSGNGGDIADSKLFTIFLEEWSRPTTGQQLKIKGTLFQGSSTKSVLEANKSLKHFSRSTTEGRSGNETGVTHSLSVVEESKLPFGVSPFNSRRRSLICE